MSQEASNWLGSMGYNLLINGVYWGYNPFTNLLLTSWDILLGNVSLTKEVPLAGSEIRQIDQLSGLVVEIPLYIPGF